ncbi:MAG: hypothetical protein HKN48_00920, partial [Flavobacteriaceae bacterium]|nr:hypothetical protein [Flavobacteriaceae bacterium]
MKTVLSIITLFIGGAIWSQVGINTANPQQLLHLEGSTSNTRIDGLNNINNSNNLGVNSSSRVYVDANGDLVLGGATNSVVFLVDSEDYLDNVENPTNLINQTGTAFGYDPGGVPTNFPADSFTLTKNAIVEVNYSVSWSVYKTNSASGRIDDTHARIVQTGLYFRQVTDPTDPYAGPAVI